MHFNLHAGAERVSTGGADVRPRAGGAGRGADRRARRVPGGAAEAGGHARSDGRDDPEGVGRGRRRLRQLRAGARGNRARERDVRRHPRRRTTRSWSRCWLRFGSDGQKRRWLRPLATGQEVGAFALSEEDAGTDAANQQMPATALAGGGFRLTGRKIWVACAARANVVLVFARDGPGAAQRTASRRSCVPMTRRASRARPRADSLGVRGLGCIDLDVARHGRAGGRRSRRRAVRRGLRGGEWALEGGRVAIAAQALGIGQAALDEALARTRSERQTFGRPIANYEAIQFMLADWPPNSTRRAC